MDKIHEKSPTNESTWRKCKKLNKKFINNINSLVEFCFQLVELTTNQYSFLFFYLFIYLLSVALGIQFIEYKLSKQNTRPFVIDCKLAFYEFRLRSHFLLDRTWSEPLTDWHFEVLSFF